MPRFAFDAIDPSGARIRGTLEATSRNVAIEQLITSGKTPVALREAAIRNGIFANAASLLGWHKFDYVLCLRELATLLKAGLGVERAFALLQGLAPSSTQALRLGQIMTQVRGGASLSQAFAAQVPEAPAYIARLMAAGEASGHLPEIVARLAANLVRARSLERKLISSLTYPAVLVVTMFAVLWLVFTSVLPRLTPMFAQAGASLPAGTQWLVTIDGIVQSYGWLLLAGFLIAIAALVWTFRVPRFRRAIDRFLLTSRVFLRLPERYEAARFCRNLQTLLEGGLSLDRALLAARDGATNLWFREQMTIVQRHVSEGEKLRSALAKANALPALVAEFSAVGEETGRLAAMMGEAASVFDEEVENRLERLTALVLPASTLILGGLIAAIMGGIVSGILAVNDLAH